MFWPGVKKIKGNKKEKTLNIVEKTIGYICKDKKGMALQLAYLKCN